MYTYKYIVVQKPTHNGLDQLEFIVPPFPFTRFLQGNYKTSNCLSHIRCYILIYTSYIYTT